ncbi:MAG: hypothetical protein QOJ64_3659 [Acidobacteriota bacterium]|jgi:uncharacterized protein|nr:hypothetical protein [Acidobacteriota bacterium]
MRIELDKLEQTGNTFAHTFEVEEIVLDEEHSRLLTPPQIRVSVRRSGHDVRLRGDISAKAEVDCDRCLKSVEVLVATEFDVKYLPVEDYSSSEVAELQDDDLATSFYEGDTIDIDELVREQILLALPGRALCGEECKGLCPVCGIDKNADSCNCQGSAVDPRWAGLEKLVNRE